MPEWFVYYAPAKGKPFSTKITAENQQAMELIAQDLASKLNAKLIGFSPVLVTE